jgi:D-alanyl-D-alanine carboxypeptidase
MKTAVDQIRTSDGGGRRIAERAGRAFRSAIWKEPPMHRSTWAAAAASLLLVAPASARRSDPCPAELAALVQRAVDKFRLPAAAVTILAAEGVVAEAVRGRRRIDDPTPATLDDYFHIGSCSKSVLAVIAAQQVERGDIEWSTRCFDALPELAAGAHPGYGSATLEDLLLCRAGLGAYTDPVTDPMPELDGTADEQRQAFVRLVLRRPPAAERQGERYAHLYSNASYVLASAMLERRAGTGWEQLVQSYFEEELDLPVHVGWPNRLDPGQPWGHRPGAAGFEPCDPEDDYALPVALAPAGDLALTARGFARYAQRHLQGLTGAAVRPGPEAFRRIHFGHDGFSLGVGNGRIGGHRFSGMDGSAGTFFCRAIYIPELDFAFAIQVNAGSGSGTMPAVDWLTAKLLKRRLGWWWKFWW